MNQLNQLRGILCLGYLLGMLSLGHAQQSATQEALELACVCLEYDSLPPQHRLSPLLDSCIGEGLYRNLTGVLREQGAQLDTDSSLFRVAQYLHEALNRDCIYFRELTQGLAAQQLEVVKEENQQSRGFLYGFNTEQQFPTLDLITPENRLERYLWLHEFDGSTRFINGIKAYQNSRIIVIWKAVELYDVVTQSYRIHREILLVEEDGPLTSKERRAWIKRYRKAVKTKDK